MEAAPVPIQGIAECLQQSQAPRGTPAACTERRQAPERGDVTQSSRATRLASHGALRVE